MSDCSLCKDTLDPEGGAILFTDSRGVPFEVCGKCEEHVALLNNSNDKTEIHSALNYITRCADKAGDRQTFDSLNGFLKQTIPLATAKRHLSKKAKVILVCIAMVVATVSAVFLVTTFQNESSFQSFSQQLFSYQMPEKTAKVNEIRWQDSNSGGIEYRAVMLIKSDLKLADVQAYYKNAGFTPARSRETNKMDLVVRDVTDPSDLYVWKTIGDEWQHKYYDDVSTYTSYYIISLKDSGYSKDFDLKYVIQ